VTPNDTSDVKDLYGVFCTPLGRHCTAVGSGTADLAKSYFYNSSTWGDPITMPEASSGDIGESYLFGVGGSA
jgi:hypothetical protein